MTSLPADLAAALLAERGFERIDDDVCRAFQWHLEVVGRRWNSAILLAGMRGATRFSEYRAMILGISDRLLTQRFKELEAEGLIQRKVVPTTPVLVQYLLTDQGRELMRLLQPLTELGRKPRLHSVSD